MAERDISALCTEHAGRIKDNARNIDKLERAMYGGNGSLGVASKTEILWRSQVWIVGLAGVVLGSTITMIVQHLAGG